MVWSCVFASLAERITGCPIIVARPWWGAKLTRSSALTRRIQGIPDGAMRALTWGQNRDITTGGILNPLINTYNTGTTNDLSKIGCNHH